MSIIEIPFSPPTDEGFHYVPQCSPGKFRWYHGTSVFFSKQIETNGFVVSHDFISSAEKKILLKISNLIPNYGSLGCPFERIINSRLSLSFAELSRGALDYASGGNKGGTFRDISSILLQLIPSETFKVEAADLAIIKEVAGRFADIPNQEGVVYALEFSEADLATLSDPGNNIRHLRSADFPPDRITHKMRVPVNFLDR